MKKSVLIILSLIMATIAFAQNQTINGNLTVKNPTTFPYGINLDVDFSTIWSREFNITHGTKNLFSIGVLSTASTLKYGYIGGGIDNNTNFQSPWMVFLPEGNIGIGTVNPVATLDVLGTSGSRGNKNFRVLYKNGGALTNTEFSALASIPSLLADENNTWAALYAKQGSASKAGVFEGDVLITNNVGIGVTNPSSKLEVNGTIRAKEVKIEATSWADFVFDKSYKLPELSDVEKHINEKQHLPGIPSEKEVLENGVNVVDMQAKLLQKIEELTLYVIEQDKQNKDLHKQVNELKSQLNNK